MQFLSDGLIQQLPLVEAPVTRASIASLRKLEIVENCQIMNAFKCHIQMVMWLSLKHNISSSVYTALHIHLL